MEPAIKTLQRYIDEIEDKLKLFELYISSTIIDYEDEIDKIHEDYIKIALELHNIKRKLLNNPQV